MSGPTISFPCPRCQRGYNPVYPAGDCYVCRGQGRVNLEDALSRMLDKIAVLENTEHHRCSCACQAKQSGPDADG